MQVNSIVTGMIVEEAKPIGALFVHYSTNYVFDGKKDYADTESDLPNPLNEYGRTKLTGEQSILTSEVAM